ncbi:response regulator [Croceimicrobium hydrocarbonivorans]|uniref:Response regulator n=1 Tax=Croceimicrobium hydrocarbonivorans TaxID=2761580 RepID=A0A7H0VJ03_9FLAO|nr:response regulator [Croceimicrobium hydrocarbonivorans]QNR25701.1 response regulator [Croceimicrobium hydrocarbonivorans]
MGGDLKLLMAEDNEINRKLADLLFKRQGFNLDFAVNGEAALESAVNGSYDLIFMDIEMPIMGGLEATRRIQDEMGDSAPPIIALTAHAMDGDRERFMEAGMSDYLTKPIDLGALQEIISRHTS